MTNKKEIVIVEALRTAVGSFGGVFKNVSAVDLGKTVLKEIVSRTKIDPEAIDEVILGNVLHGGLGQNVARQVAIHSDIPNDKTAFTLDMVCGSGLKAIQLAVQSIQCGDSEVVIAGGTENMSQAPYVLPNLRFGQRLGNGTVIDSLVNDGLTDAFHHYHMGITAENIAEKFAISREEQDAFAQSSQEKAIKAVSDGRFKEEIVPVLVSQRKQKEPILITEDEYPKKDSTIATLQKLRPAFRADGTVTAGNASGINDGAAMVLMMTREKAESLQLPILASIVSYASAGVAPELMGTGPIPASKKALEKAQLTIADIELIEANEAFAAQAISVMKELKLNPDRVNVNGGAIALGHPIGASGARILVTLIHELKRRKLSLGLATLCIGGGQGTSLIIKNEA
ncbi:acetyl-CoA C-acetyltransferase [Vagococcus sp. BWB3-3]|uniref:acetyl-CoA C-acetyltransferase n=1 Tax=Vagococcus allomyrinae TaxID=2794353 RepID=A0A940SVV5_9ENTE|nr:acetyl-CoA C-acetyltransferase [Vagococcus allomyrinae]MBP1040723.1 acetyl-CoA C-acetyltransferase [Vagococcus allomyrinae]